MVLNDWQRGKLPYFVPPPGCILEPRPEGDDGDVEEQDIDDIEDLEEIQVLIVE